MENYDAIIVGGGPAGSTTAAMLGKKGRKVLLLDKATFPRDKTCGDAVSGKSMRALRELDLDKEIETKPHGKITGVTFSSPDGKIVEIPFPESPDRGAPGYCCRREIVDNMLFQNAKKYAETIEGCTVTDLVMENGFAAGVKAKKGGEEEEFRAKLIVGADGAQSVIARKLGADKNPDEHHCTAVRAYYKNVRGMNNNIELHFVNSVLPGYFWIFPMEDGFANVGVGMVASKMKKGKVNLQKAMEDAIKNDPIFKERFLGAEQVGPVKGWTLPFGSYHRKCHGNGWVLVGDAASLIDPFTGEGVGNATTSGMIASEVIDEALARGDVSEAALKEYDVKLWEEIGPELKTSYNLQRLGSVKMLLNFVIGKAHKSKEIRDTISGMLSNEKAKKDFVSPFFYLKLLFS